VTKLLTNAERFTNVQNLGWEIGLISRKSSRREIVREAIKFLRTHRQYVSRSLMVISAVAEWSASA